MRRSRSLILLAALGVALLTARLGFWQLERAAQKELLQAQMGSQRAMPAVPLPELATTLQMAFVQEHRRLVVQGEWRAEHMVYLENRQMQGRPGFYVLTPLVLSDGSALLVQRGWIGRHFQDRTQLAAVLTPPGTVQVQGHIALNPSRLFEFSAAASGAIRQNLDIGPYARETGLNLRPLVLVQDDSSPPQADGLLRDWPLPATGVYKHHGYAFQWFALCALTLALYVWFQIILPRRRSKPALG